MGQPYGFIQHVVQIMWVGLISYNEMGAFRNRVLKCAWPDASLELSSSDGLQTPTHVLVLADPQILDSQSYPGRHPLLLWLTRVLVDGYLRKSWNAAMRLKPDMVIFLGDMMDGGRYALSDEQYEEYYQRFRRIFRTDPAHSLPTYYIPGNHDVGLGQSSRSSDRAVARYTSHFGPLNQVVEVGQHTFILVDAPGLVEEEVQRARSGHLYDGWAERNPSGTIAFVHDLASRRTGQNVLFTHIPLARPEGAACGPFREHDTIREGWGSGYQNTLSAQTSQFLLQNTQPLLAMSGDDHDYCEFWHTYGTPDDFTGSPTKSVMEVTVKSFSMVMGVRNPGFQLLSLSPIRSTGETLATSPCLLPDQLGTYLSIYLPALLLSVLVLMVSNVHRVRTNNRWTEHVPIPECMQWMRFERTIVIRGRALRVVFPFQSAKIPRADDSLTDIKSDWKDGHPYPGVWRGFLGDVVGVAWWPVLTFAGIVWWAT